MILPLATPRSLFVTFLAVGVVAIVGCGGDPGPITSASSKYEVDDGDDSGTATPQTSTGSATDPGPTIEPIQLSPSLPGPPGTAPPRSPANSPAVATGPASDKPEDLMAYVAQLGNREPTGTSREEVIADFLRSQDEIIGICERVFEMDTTPELRLAAAETKARSLAQMLQLGNAEASQRLDDFVVTLKATKDDALLSLGFQIGFSGKMEALRAGKEVDPESVIDDLNHLVVTEAKDLELLRIGSTVAAILEQTGHPEQAVKAFRLLADVFKESDDERLRINATGLMERAQLLESDITTMLSELLDGKDEAIEPFVAAAQGLLQHEGAGLVTLDFFQQVAPTLEIAKPEVAAKIYTAIGTAFKESANDELAQMAEQITTSYELRASLVGKPFIVEGTCLDGQELDWSQYQNKIVLVDFWSTSRLVEMNNIRENYDRYHDQGFEVVGVNLDEDMQSLQRFISFQKLPWPSVIGADPATRGWSHPMVQKYGVSSVPFLVLVGKDGNVLASNIRGDALGEQLAKLFPNVDPAPPASETPAPPVEGTPDAPKKPTTDPPPEPVAPQTPAPEPAAPKTPDPEPAANDGAKTGTRPSFDRRSRRVNGFVGIRAPGLTPSPQEPSAAIADDEDDANNAETNEDAESEVNPYSPPSGLSARQLVDFIFSMQEKPLSIQRRPGFAAAIADAADQVLAAEASDQLQIVAAEAKFEVLHQAASLGDAQADRQLDEFVHRMQDDTRARIVKQVEFFRLERKALNADEIPLATVPELLGELEEYFASQKLKDKHLRIASATVHAINRITDGPTREAYFEKFGAQFATSKGRNLARYGRKIGQAPAQPTSELVGKPLELEGITALGTSFEWAAYRGKVVVVDFWATWCGPCRRETPHLQALAKTSDKLAIVAVNLDQDLEAVEKYLDQNQIEWTNLVGEEATRIASKYGIRAIPTMLVVDVDGNVVAVGNKVAEIQSKVQQLLAG